MPLPCERLLAFLTNRRNQNAPPAEQINSTTAFAPLNNGSTVVIMSRKKTAASVAPYYFSTTIVPVIFG
jgi:hypothetical protein